MSVSPRSRRTGNAPHRVSRGGSPLIPTHGSPGVPHSVWLPPRGAVLSPAVACSVLPGWALERACAQFAPAGGPAAVLLPPGPGYTERTAHPTGSAPGWLGAAQPVELADAGRARLALALLLAEPVPDGVTEPQKLPGFLAEIRAALRPGAVLLVHTHPAHTKAGMHDPAAGLLRAARRAGFTYLQHLVLIHHPLTAVTAPRALRSAGQPGAAHRRVHSDLYVLTDANGATR
jgi:hypothetical protein